MKKIFLSLLIASAGIAASAQTYLDAYSFAQDEYYGTARSVAMGNALTAVGGDVGSLVINPAGSAVAGYSQVTLTPGFSVSSTLSQGTPLSGEAFSYGFEDTVKSSKTRFTLPSVGMTFNFNTRRNRGVKNVAIGFVYSTTNLYLNSLNASGTNNSTSISGYFAQVANGYTASSLDASGAYDAGIPWEAILAYRGGLIATRQGFDDVYIGAAETALTNGEAALAGTINQNYGRLTTGSKGSMLFNVGLNISDFLYLGANISLVTLTYSYSDSMRESVNTDDPTNANKFKQEFITDEGTVETRFDNLRYRQFWKDRGTGINAKFGIIGRPVAGLRLGLTIQTPTIINIKETYNYDAQSQYVNANFSSSEESPSDQFSYRLRTPMSFSFGAAYTFADKALVSADYELVDYANMRMSAGGNSVDDSYTGVNTDIVERMGLGHTVRVGAEYKPIPALAIRAGFNFISCAEKDPIFGRYYNTRTLSGALGIGYSSPGSFFVDAAARLSFQPDNYITPYGDYYDDGGNIIAAAPQILTKRRLFSALVTVGWRF